jgi:hypothetical protein
VLDHNVCSLIEVDISSWLCLCFVLLLNTIRAALFSGSEEEEEAHRRLSLGGADDELLDIDLLVPGGRRGLGAEAEAAADSSCGCAEDDHAEDDGHRLLSSFAANASHTFLRVLGEEAADASESCDACVAERRLGPELARFLAAAAAEPECDPCALVDAGRRLGGDAATDAACACASAATRRLGGAVDPCAALGGDGFVSFIFIGWLLLVSFVVLAYLSRSAELKMYRLIGLNKWQDFADYITKADKLIKEREEAILAEQHKAAEDMPEEERNKRQTRKRYARAKEGAYAAKAGKWGGDPPPVKPSLSRGPKPTACFVRTDPPPTATPTTASTRRP